MGKLADVIREGVSMPDQKRAQILRLDQEFSVLESENKSLKVENAKLQAIVNPLQRQVQELKARIKRQDSTALDDIADAMLVLIASGGQYRESLMESLHLSKAKCDYHFDSLNKRGFAIEKTGLGMGSSISATPEGREYLAQRGKL